MDKLGIIGLGYVGLPLAVEFAKKYPVIGFDIKKDRIDNLKDSVDNTKEVSLDELVKTSQLLFTTDSDDLKDVNIYIISVPTPIDQFKTPDLQPLRMASKTVGKYLGKNDIVIYESTVYPGCTEEVCVPILEETSGLKYNTDFFCGYSPERINPGDKNHRLTDIKKVTSGSTSTIAKKVDELYSSIIKAGTHLASSISVAEAAKVIENAQRDLNIAFVNELAVIFDKMKIDTHEVLEAAGTKWNFLNFKPGLVGGHCIGVDPYYLTHKAEQLGHHPEVILAGRKTNDSMGVVIASQIIKLMVNHSIPIFNCDLLMLGITFKENCPDIRNSKVIDLVNELKGFGLKVDVYDPWADKTEVKNEYGIDLIASPEKKYHAIIHAVSHEEFASIDFGSIKNNPAVVYDVKGSLDRNLVDKRL